MCETKDDRREKSEMFFHSGVIAGRGIANAGLNASKKCARPGGFFPRGQNISFGLEVERLLDFVVKSGTLHQIKHSKPCEHFIWS
jgi:hypothetical protein